jgi:hypothetical protein
MLAEHHEVVELACFPELWKAALVKVGELFK